MNQAKIIFPNFIPQEIKKKININQEIENLVYVFSFPIIGHNNSWNTPTKEIRQSIILDRIIQLIKERELFREFSTDSEAMWYLSTASLDAPLNHKYAQVYMWTFREWYKSHKKNEVPDFLKDVPDELDDYTKNYILNQLKRSIRKTQLKHVKKINVKKETQKPKEPLMIQAALF